MLIQAINCRAGDIILLDGNIYTIMVIDSVERGRGKSYVQLTLRNVKSKTKTNTRLATDDVVEKLNNTQEECVFLYREGDNIEVMRSDTFEQISVSIDALNEDSGFLKEEMTLLLNLIEDEIVSVDFKNSEVYEVLETDPPSSRNSLKDAYLQNRILIKVPDFIRSGDRIRINIKERKYLEKE